MSDGTLCQQCKSEPATVHGTYGGPLLGGDASWSSEMKLCRNCKTRLDVHQKSYARTLQTRAPTLRDRFAMAALANLERQDWGCVSANEHLRGSATDLADAAYSIADAMLERSKK